VPLFNEFGNHLRSRALTAARVRGVCVADESNQSNPFPDHEDRMTTILVVDDEPLIRMAISDFLQECGFKVLEASNAGEAIEMIKSNQSVIDLVFTDVKMPGEMNGFGLAKWIRENAPVPVILTSGDANKSDAARELCAEERFLSKPYELGYVLAQIRQALVLRKEGTD
jgi:CheY-like chemotaxis protein